MVHGGEHRARCQTSDVVGIGRGKGVLIDHRRAPARNDDAGDVFPGVNPSEIVVGRRSRLQHGAALLAESSGHGLKRLGAFRPFRVSCRCDVINESGRADENQRHALRLCHLPAIAAFHLTWAPAG